MRPIAVRFTIFSLVIAFLAVGMTVAVLHEGRGINPYQSGVVFR